MSVRRLSIDSVTSFLDSARRRLEATERRRLNYAALARRGNIPSRAHVREVFLGKRQLIPSTAGSLARALSLRARERRTLLDLAHYESLRADGDVESANRLRKRIDSRRPILEWQPYVIECESPARSIPEFVKFPGWVKVLAALGPKDAPTDLETIVRESRTESTDVARILASLGAEGLIETTSGAGAIGYSFSHSQLVAEKMRNCEFSKNAVLSALAETRVSVERGFSDRDKLFQWSTLRVNRGAIPKLRERLIAIADQFIAESNEPGGDEIVSLLVAFHPLETGERGKSPGA